MYASFDPDNLLHWLSLFVALTGMVSLFIAWRKFRLQYKKPKIEIVGISAKPTLDDRWGGRESDCYIRFHVFNPSSFGNHISGNLRRFYFFPIIKKKIYLIGTQSQWGDFCELPPSKRITVSMYPEYENVEKYKHKHLLLTIKDIRRKKTRKWFKFEDYPKKEE